MLLCNINLVSKDVEMKVWIIIGLAYLKSLYIILECPLTVAFECALFSKCQNFKAVAKFEFASVYSIPWFVIQN